jgi:transcriptional regulator with XRE-family HTH domain
MPTLILPSCRQDRHSWSKPEIIGDELRIARNCAAVTQQELADLLRTTRKRIGKIEAGKVEVSLNEIESWASALGTEVDLIIHNYLVTVKNQNGQKTRAD